MALPAMGDTAASRLASLVLIQFERHVFWIRKQSNVEFDLRLGSFLGERIDHNLGTQRVSMRQQDRDLTTLQNPSLVRQSQPIVQDFAN